MSRSILLSASSTGPVGRQETQQCAVFIGKSFRFDHKQNYIDIREGLGDDAVHVPIQCTRMPCLKSRRINKQQLRVIAGQNARNALARCLRLARRNADLLAHQAVEERGFTDVRTPDDCNIAGAKLCGRLRHLHAAAEIVSAPCCSLFCAAPAGAFAFRPDIQLRNGAFDAETLLVRFAGRCDYRILRYRHAPCL